MEGFMEMFKQPNADTKQDRQKNLKNKCSPTNNNNHKIFTKNRNKVIKIKNNKSRNNNKKLRIQNNRKKIGISDGRGMNGIGMKNFLTQTQQKTEKTNIEDGDGDSCDDDDNSYGNDDDSCDDDDSCGLNLGDKSAFKVKFSW